MNNPIQLDLFATDDPEPLNGMYYEKKTNKFVSYVKGRRHFEVTPGRCLGDEAWKEKTMKERAI
ncbi:hypothetical protein G9G53_22450 [Paenibacillus sp. EKM206P]|uniref:hypothetical protein n=1 Tax=Paenibacillus sp. EKM206P TaxID=1683674 RepID=UPI0013ED2547|nr:hypothetical protein [Paenibacillus sp. EKM206P]KAF6569056.1 hypothetical protein G9G53_22450 [Paenibacillus sp. EKM206P]